MARIESPMPPRVDGHILTRRVWSRRVDCVPCPSKYVKVSLAATKFPSRIRANAFGINRRSGAPDVKSCGEPFDGRSLGAKSTTVNRVTGVVAREYVTYFAMQAAKAADALAILGRLHDKSKVDRNTLIALSSFAGRRGRLIGFVDLGLDRSRWR
jgi:hypothetical protein